MADRPPRQDRTDAERGPDGDARPDAEEQPDAGEHDAADGDGGLDDWMPRVYEELRQIAHRHLRRETPGHTLNTTGLVHESYMRLAGSGDLEWESRAHFFAIASRAMRHILVDYARRRSADKRGGDRVRVTLGDAMASSGDGTEDLIELDDALESLGELDERLVHVVECRFFGGMSVPETAEALDVSARTVERDWMRAKAYLSRALRPE